MRVFEYTQELLTLLQITHVVNMHDYCNFSCWGMWPSDNSVPGDSCFGVNVLGKGSSMIITWGSHLLCKSDSNCDNFNMSSKIIRRLKFLSPYCLLQNELTWPPDIMCYTYLFASLSGFNLQETPSAFGSMFLLLHSQYLDPENASECPLSAWWYSLPIMATLFSNFKEQSSTKWCYCVE